LQDEDVDTVYKSMICCFLKPK